MTDQITVLVQTQESTLQLAKVPKPKAGPGQLLVKVTHAAQNPTDGKSLLTSLFLNGRWKVEYSC
jgi:NADPH:quinone reductase-like Zn-dependent oxidoreductase